MKLPQKQVRSCLNGLKERNITDNIKDLKTVTIITSPTEGDQRFNICLKICKNQVKYNCFCKSGTLSSERGKLLELMPYANY
jgi:hypothetical protein